MLNGFFSHRLLALMRKEFSHIRRDTRIVMSLIVPPALLLLLFGFVLNSKIENVRLGVIDQSGSSESRELIADLSVSRSFRLTRAFLSPGDLSDAVMDGRAGVPVRCGDPGRSDACVAATRHADQSDLPLRRHCARQHVEGKRTRNALAEFSGARADRACPSDAEHHAFSQATRIGRLPFMKRFDRTYRLASSGSLALMLLVARPAEAQVVASPPAQGAVTSQLPLSGESPQGGAVVVGQAPSPARQPASIR